MGGIDLLPDISSVFRDVGYDSGRRMVGLASLLYNRDFSPSKCWRLTLEQ